MEALEERRLLSSSALITLAVFNGTDGEYPYAGLTLSGSTLYGTDLGGANNIGSVFSVPVNGGTPTLLASFNGTDGGIPQSDLTLSGSTLYGTNYGGGTSTPYTYGTVFSVPVTGGTPTALASFNFTDGSEPKSGLTLSGSTLYGTTSYGGGQAIGHGTVFSVPVTGGTPTVLASFNGTNGEDIVSGLTLSGSTFYGTADYGWARIIIRRGLRLWHHFQRSGDRRNPHGSSLVQRHGRQ